MKTKFLIFIILALGLCLRLFSLNQSLWLDEGIMAYAVSHFTLPALLTDYLVGDFNPPLYFICLWLWVKIFGINEIALRIPSVIFGCLTIHFVYLWGKQISSLPKRNAGLIAALFAASAPLLIFYSQEARMYALACLMGTVSMYYFYRYFYLKKSAFIWYLGATIMMFWSHYIVWFLWIVQLGWLFIIDGKKIAQKLYKILLPLVGIIPILPILYKQLQAALASASDLVVWKSLSSLSLKQLILIPLKLTAGRIPLDSNIILSLMIIIALIVWLGVLIKSYGYLKNNSLILSLKLDNYQKLLWLWLLLPVLIGAILSFKLSLFSYFRFLYIAPAFYLLAGDALSKQLKKRTVTLVSVLVFFNLSFSAAYLFNHHNHREDWRGAVAYLQNRKLTDKVVILDSVSRPFWYYDRDQMHLIDYSNVGDIRQEDSIWLVKYAQEIFDPLNITEDKIIREFGFEILEEKYFRGDIRIKYLIKSYKPMAYDYRY